MNKENNDNQPRRGAGDLQSVTKSIMPLARSILGKKGFVEVDILTDWSGIVGEELAAYTLPQKIDFKPNQKNNGILHLMVPSGAFALEIQHRDDDFFHPDYRCFFHNPQCFGHQFDAAEYGSDFAGFVSDYVHHGADF
jgi:hypothetical protein